MGVEPPFLYDAVPKDSSRHPYSSFDPKAVSRASLAPKAPRPKQNGPLVSFNRHPDSYLIVPYGNTNATPMNPSVKSWIKWMRILQLGLRCLEILGAMGLLTMMILIRNVDVTTGWIMRVVPGVAILHTLYGLYHLARRPSGRTPASSASYMFFAAFFDASILPFYAFSALVAMTRQGAWTTVLSNQDLMPLLSKVVFYLATVSGGLHLISLMVSIYLAVTFRKITKLPPDMNPLEDNLTARPHKRNKSSLSVSTVSEKRESLPDGRRKSAAPYEELSRPPTIPFLHTRTGSTDSFSTYKSTPPGSRDSRLDLPSRQYEAGANSAQSSMTELKRSSVYGSSTPPSYREFPQSDTSSQRSFRPSSSPPKQSSYAKVPLLDNSMRHSAPSISNQSTMKEAWYTSDSLVAPRVRNSPSKKGSYQPLQQSSDDLPPPHPNGLQTNPPTTRYNKSFRPLRDSPLSEINNNRTPSSSDIASVSIYSQEGLDEIFPDSQKKKSYGELKATARTPVLVGGEANRQVSSGVDFSGQIYGNDETTFRRDVSGKIAEEGRGGGPRFRQVSGMLQ